MKYVSIDLETSGLDPERCQILEFAAVIDDGVRFVTELPTFHRYVIHDEYRGEPYALAMHSEIFKRIAKRDKDYKYIGISDLALAFKAFLLDNDLKSHITVAGKNFANFDLRFLRRVPGWNNIIGIRHRMIDPGCLYWSPIVDKERLPNLTTCLLRAGFVKTVSHTAVEDAIDVIYTVRRFVNVKVT